MPSLPAEGVSRCRWFALCALLLGSAGCGGPGYRLDGSLAELVPLEYLGAELTLTADSLSLRFLTVGEAGDDTVLRVLARTQGLDLGSGARIDLAEPMPEGGQRGLISRSVHGDERKELPPLMRGHLTLGAALVAAAPVDAELSLAFEQGHAFAAGRTVFGEFQAHVEP